MNGQTFLALDAIKNADVEQLILLQALADVDPPDRKSKIATANVMNIITDASHVDAREVSIIFPSNPDPIETVSLTHAGKNLFDISQLTQNDDPNVNFRIDGNSIYITNQTRYYSVNAFNGFSTYLIAGDYSMSVNNLVSKNISLRSADGQTIVALPAFTENSTFSILDPGLYELVLMVGYNESYSISNLQLEYGNEVSEYEPYVGHTYTFDISELVGDVYEGTMNLTKGVFEINGTEVASIPRQKITMFEGLNAFSVSKRVDDFVEGTIWNAVRIKYASQE